MYIAYTGLKPGACPTFQVAANHSAASSGDALTTSSLVIPAESNDFHAGDPPDPPEHLGGNPGGSDAKSGRFRSTQLTHTRGSGWGVSSNGFCWRIRRASSTASHPGSSL